MNAWLLTWESHTKQALTEKIAAVLASRRSDQWVGDFMELLVLRATRNAGDMAYYANRSRQFPAQRGMVINGIPHGDRIICGHDPWLYGRKVSKLKTTYDPATDHETISWKEPPQFRWRAGSQTEIEVAAEGELRDWRRHSRPISRDTWNWAE